MTTPTDSFDIEIVDPLNSTENNDGDAMTAHLDQINGPQIAALLPADYTLVDDGRRIEVRNASTTLLSGLAVPRNSVLASVDLPSGRGREIPAAH